MSLWSKQAAQRKLSDFSGEMNVFPDLHCRQSSKSVTGARRWRRATRGGGFVERLRWLSLQASSGPTNKSSTSLLVNMVFVSFSSYWCVQQNLLFCVKGDFGKKHVVLKAIKKPSSFADANAMFFFFFSGNTCFLRLHQNLKKMVWMMNNARWTWKKTEPADIDGTGLLT